MSVLGKLARHYVNLPIHYNTIIHESRSGIHYMVSGNIFAPNIDEAVPSTHNLSFSPNKKNNISPANPTCSYKKSGFPGCSLHGLDNAHRISDVEMKAGMG